MLPNNHTTKQHLEFLRQASTNWLMTKVSLLYMLFFDTFLENEIDTNYVGVSKNQNDFQHFYED